MGQAVTGTVLLEKTDTALPNSSASRGKAQLGESVFRALLAAGQHRQPGSWRLGRSSEEPDPTQRLGSS